MKNLFSRTEIVSYMQIDAQAEENGISVQSLNVPQNTDNKKLFFFGDRNVSYTNNTLF
jgi:hypothetical protein